MADVPSRPSGGTSRGLWILVYVLLAPAVVVPLLVPLYDKTDPTLFGFPFFYWFQFALIIGASVLTLRRCWSPSAPRRATAPSGATGRADL